MVHHSLTSSLKLRRLGILGNLVFQSQDVANLLTSSDLSQSKQMLLSSACLCAIQCPTRHMLNHPLHRLLTLAKYLPQEFAERCSTSQYVRELTEVEKDKFGIFCTANVSPFPVSVRSKELSSSQFCAHISWAKIEKKPYNSAMDEMNTMYYTVWDFDFITNGYY